MRERMQRIGPLLGLDNITAMVDGVEVGVAPKGALRVADDILLDRDGWPAARPGLTLAVADAHSVWSSQDGTVYAILDGDVIRIEASPVVVHALPTDDPGRFCDGPGCVYVAQGAHIARIDARGGRQIGVTDAQRPLVTPAAIGGLQDGTYHVGVAHVSAAGEEGGLSPLARVQVAAGGGITVTAAWPADAVSAIVYRTAQNGDSLHRCATIPAGFGAFLIGAGELTAQPQTRHLTRMPGGRLMRWWRGRLLVARGDALVYSHPYSPHLHDPRSSWIRLPGYATMIEPVEGGLWLASRAGVMFARGTDPASLDIAKVAAPPPPDGASASINGDLLRADLQLGGQRCAIWWSDGGFVIGTPDGRAIALNERVFRAPPASAGVVVIHDRRVTAYLR